MNYNDRLLRAVIGRLTNARLNPPTVTSFLFHWASLPSLVLVGVVGVSALVALGLPSQVPTLMAGVCLGAALRDFGIARRTVRVWPIHLELFDWQKIDALAQSIADRQSGKAD
ncbi:MAG: hypothetical protein ACLQNE_36280 [Thermoguttaceae bacterium]